MNLMNYMKNLKNKLYELIQEHTNDQVSAQVNRRIKFEPNKKITWILYWKIFWKFENNMFDKLNLKILSALIDEINEKP